MKIIVIVSGELDLGKEDVKVLKGLNPELMTAELIANGTNLRGRVMEPKKDQRAKA